MARQARTKQFIKQFQSLFKPTSNKMTRTYLIKSTYKNTTAKQEIRVKKATPKAKRRRHLQGIEGGWGHSLTVLSTFWTFFDHAWHHWPRLTRIMDSFHLWSETKIGKFLITANYIYKTVNTYVSPQTKQHQVHTYSTHMLITKPTTANDVAKNWKFRQISKYHYKACIKRKLTRWRDRHGQTIRQAILKVLLQPTSNKMTRTYPINSKYI